MTIKQLGLVATVLLVLLAAPVGAVDLTETATPVWETQFSAATFDSARDVAVDSHGDIFLMLRIYDTNNDVGIAKVGADGAHLYTTYLRGSALDYATGITVDGDDNLVVVGYSDSDDFPIVNAMQPVSNGLRDAFVAKLAGSDGSILFSTFFGGDRADQINDVVVDPGGDIHVAGETDSTDFPTVDPIQPNLNTDQCFCSDAFVSTISGDGTSVLFSTYLGGAWDDRGAAIAVGVDGDRYLAGTTDSDDFPTANPFQALYAGEEDGFAARLNPSGLVYSTYLGGDDWDRVARVDVDASGALYVSGSTRSPDFPVTPGSYRDTFVGAILGCEVPFGADFNCDDIYVAKLLPDGSALAYGTFIGGTDEDTGSGLVVDHLGRAHVVGFSDSPDFPLGSPGGFDIIMAQLDPDGASVVGQWTMWSSVANDGHGIDLAPDGTVIVAGAVNAPSDTYVAKLAPGAVAFGLLEPDPGTAGVVNTFTALGAGDGDRVVFVASKQAGTTVVPGCPGLELEVAAPKILGSATADAGGTAEVSRSIPAALAGQTVLIQAVDRTACTVTPLLPVVFD